MDSYDDPRMQQRQTPSPIYVPPPEPQQSSVTGFIRQYRMWIIILLIIIAIYFFFIKKPKTLGTGTGNGTKAFSFMRPS